MSNRIICVNSNCYHGFSIEEALEGIAAAGFHNVELTATKGWTEHIFPDQTFEYLCSVKDKMAALGLTPFSMSGHCNLMDPDRIPDFIMNMRLAKFFGCRYIVSSVGEAHLKDNTKLGIDDAAKKIGELVPELEKNDLILVLELHGEHSTGTIMQKLIKKIDSPRIKINYDTANCIFYGDVDAADDVDTCMENIAYLHLKDKAGARNAWDFPALGRGYVDFETLFSKLENAQNDAPFSVEIEFTQAGAKDLAEVNQAVAESGAYLKAHGFQL